MLSVEEVRSGLNQAGQQHVLQFWADLSDDEKKTFLSELSQLHFDDLRDHCRVAAEAAAQSTTKVQQKLEPVPPEFIGSVLKSDQDSINEWENEGYLQISENKVAVLLLAGGQGTRLGVPYPKGMYDVGLPSKNTLYQIQAERICRVQQLCNMKHGSKCIIPWYIMTSEFTLDPTKRFFEENKHFGLDPSNVVMFEQRMIPAVTFDGKVILQNKGKLAMAPDGNGGLYRALVDNQVLEDMQRRGVKYLHVYCVDNILVKMADPIFIGFCVSKQADCGAKVVQKASPEEPVGVVCSVDGVFQVVEYSELPLEVAEQRLPGGELRFSTGNICNHFFTLGFLQEVALKFQSQLKQHVAVKKVPFVDNDGNMVNPTKPNGIKMEKFVFDVFQFSRKFVAFEVAREDEFSPLKNGPGAPLDTPSSVRRSLLAQHLRWVLAAGGSFLESSRPRVTLEEEPLVVCEISPLVSYFGEGLDLILKHKVFTSPFLLDEKTAKQLLQ